MTKKVKPDGYCGWHPQHGFLTPKHYTDEAVHSSEKRAKIRLARYLLPVDHALDSDLESPDKVVDIEIERHGWSIAPVCLVPPELLEWVEKVRTNFDFQVWNTPLSIQLKKIWPKNN